MRYESKVPLLMAKPPSAGQSARVEVKRRTYNVFVVSTEGKTERQYFSALNTMLETNGGLMNGQPRIRLVKRNATDSSTEEVRIALDNYINPERSNQKYDMREGDQAWLVIDADQENRPEEQVNKLYQWTVRCQKDPKRKGKYRLAVSNPCFEAWLLLHFDDKSPTVPNCEEYVKRLKKHIPGYSNKNKNIDTHSHRFMEDNIRKATERSRARDKPTCKDWPRDPGITTVYRLVEKLFPPRS